MLPGAHGLWIAPRQRGSRGVSARQVWNESILRPVPATDDVACSSGSYRGPLGGKEGGAIARCGDLSRCLVGAVRVMPAERIILTIGIDPLLVAIDLVGGRDHGHFDSGKCSQGVEYMGCSHDIRGHSFDGRAITGSHQRLGSEMENDLRFGG